MSHAADVNKALDATPGGTAQREELRRDLDQRRETNTRWDALRGEGKR